MEVLDALDIKLIHEEIDETSKIKWDVLGFDEHFFWIQIDFEDPKIGQS